MRHWTYFKQMVVSAVLLPAFSYDPKLSLDYADPLSDERSVLLLWTVDNFRNIFFV